MFGKIALSVGMYVILVILFTTMRNTISSVVGSNTVCISVIVFVYYIAIG